MRQLLCANDGAPACLAMMRSIASTGSTIKIERRIAFEPCDEDVAIRTHSRRSGKDAAPSRLMTYRELRHTRAWVFKQLTAGEPRTLMAECCS